MAGANIIEKHATIDPGKKRIDFNSAVGVDALLNIKIAMECLNKAKGDGSFKITEYEKPYGKNGPMKFTIVANKNLAKGSILKKSDMTFRRTGEKNNIPQKDYLKFLGKKTSKDVTKFRLVNWSNVER